MDIYQMRGKIEASKHDDYILPSDRFVVGEKRARELTNLELSPRVIFAYREINIEVCNNHNPNAPVMPVTCPFAREAIRSIAKPRAECRGYPDEITTILFEGDVVNVKWTIKRQHDSYSGFSGRGNHLCWVLQ